MIGNNDLMKEIGIMLKAHPRGASAIAEKVKQLYELSIDNLLTAPEESAKCTLIGECRAYRDIMEMLQFALTVDPEASQANGAVKNSIGQPIGKGALNIV